VACVQRLGPGHRQDAAGKVHVFNDPAGSRTATATSMPTAMLPDHDAPCSKAAKPATAYNRSTNTPEGGQDGYINRSATSSMMPRKAPSMYDPATGAAPAQETQRLPDLPAVNAQRGAPCGPPRPIWRGWPRHRLSWCSSPASAG
jgi:hypothetical protein